MEYLSKRIIEIRQEHARVMFVGPMQVRSDNDDDVGSILCRAQLLWVCDFGTGGGGIIC